MFPLRPLIAKDAAIRVLDQAIHDPAYRWVPVSPLPSAAVLGAKADWTRAFPTPNTDLASRKDLEGLVDWYMRAGLWDFAFLVVYLAYCGTGAPRSMLDTVWDGSPGLSRLWMVRGQTMRPLPRTGPLTQALSTWWALSGGYLNQRRQYLPVSITDFQTHLESVDSPAIHLMPFGSDDPMYIMDRILTATDGPDFAYPARTRILPFPAAPNNTPTKHGAMWAQDIPVDWSPNSYSSKELPTDFVRNCPWGMEWLEKARDTIPPRIYDRAYELRANGFCL